MKGLLVVILTLFVQNIWAKELTNRLGVGYSNQFSTDLPSLSVRYYPSPMLGLSAALGVDTGEKDQNNSRFGLAVKVYKIINDSFKEDNLNFYMGTGVGLISKKSSSGSNSTGFELNGYVGGEFFFSGLDNLGFNFEAGIGVTSVSSEVRFRTIGENPIKAGMTFYF